MKCAILSSLLLFLFLHSCQDSITTIKGCCGDPPIAGWFPGGGWFIAPNAITPNGDGINDSWTIYGDSVTIREIKIRNPQNVLVFQAENLSIQKSQIIWDGHFHGGTEFAMFDFELQIESYNNTIYNYKGKVCSFPCTDPDKELTISRGNCLLSYMPEFTHEVFDPCFDN